MSETVERHEFGAEVGHYAMVVHFSLAGYLFVNALVGIDPGPSPAASSTLRAA